MNRSNCENILGYPVTMQDKESCVDQILASVAAEEKGRYLVCANPHSLEIARSDRLFREAILRADLITPDGVGMVLASRILGGNIRDRVTGSDIFWGLCRKLNQDGGYRCFFLGSTEENLSRIQEKLRNDYSNIQVAGSFSPPFKEEFSPEESNAMIEAVNQASPDVLWVGMTAPKQEKWVYQHKDRLNVSFIGAIGAAFDFYAGTVRRSHPWFQKRGFEWLPRLLREPRRLWYRNVVSFPKFMMRATLQRLSNTKEQTGHTVHPDARE